jgi:hypothetical protein
LHQSLHSFEGLSLVHLTDSGSSSTGPGRALRETWSGSFNFVTPSYEASCFLRFLLEGSGLFVTAKLRKYISQFRVTYFFA